MEMVPLWGQLWREYGWRCGSGVPHEFHWYGATKGQGRFWSVSEVKWANSWHHVGLQHFF